jgi:hypothetical protein
VCRKRGTELNPKDKDSRVICQNTYIPDLGEGPAETPWEPWTKRLRHFIRRRMKPRQVRAFKTKSARLLDFLSGRSRGRPGSSHQAAAPAVPKFKAGDLVRVRTKEEIKSTLNYWGQLKNCRFMSDMSPYCGTTQRVLKTVERFVDERDNRIKKSHGLVLLEGVYCQGTPDFGRCDRSCFFFWREEWLEKLDGPAGPKG